MRLFCLEVKRILKSRRTLILLAVALFLAVIMAYLPISFESINRPGENGTVIELNGLDAIQFKREYRQQTDGEVTPEKVADALRTYQKYVQEYGTADDIPLDVYTDASHLNDIMNLEQEDHPSAKEFATEKYSEVDKPFQLYSGLSRDAFDYIELYIFILSILCVAIAAPTFANEYQTGSDSIMRCTKNGRVKFAVTRILAAGCIFVVVFIFGMVIHLSIINLAFGTECLKTSFQMLFSIINLPNINLGQLQVILVLAGLLSLLASISCTLFLSAKCKDSLSSLLISLAVMLLPTIIYTALGGSVWISTVLPSAGIGLQNNFLYQLYGFNFLYVGDMSFWTPYVILISAVIEIPAFTVLAIRSYCKHRVA